MERQNFGFLYQRDFYEKNNLIENKEYTGKFDTQINGLDCQIKTYKNKGELMMADPFRYLKNTKDFILVVANRDNSNRVLSEKVLYIKNSTLQSFFKKEHFKERIEYCKNVLDSVSNNKTDDEIFKKKMNKEKLARKSSIINIQAKRDHKNQKRVQWSIPNRHIDAFLNMFENYETRN